MSIESTTYLSSSETKSTPRIPLLTTNQKSRTAENLHSGKREHSFSARETKKDVAIDEDLMNFSVVSKMKKKTRLTRANTISDPITDSPPTKQRIKVDPQVFGLMLTSPKPSYYPWQNKITIELADRIKEQTSDKKIGKIARALLKESLQYTTIITRIKEAAGLLRDEKYQFLAEFETITNPTIFNKKFKKLNEEKGEILKSIIGGKAVLRIITIACQNDTEKMLIIDAEILNCVRQHVDQLQRTQLHSPKHWFPDHPIFLFGSNLHSLCEKEIEQIGTIKINDKEFRPKNMSENPFVRLIQILERCLDPAKTKEKCISCPTEICLPPLKNIEQKKNDVFLSLTRVETKKHMFDACQQLHKILSDQEGHADSERLTDELILLKIEELFSEFPLLKAIFKNYSVAIFRMLIKEAHTKDAATFADYIVNELYPELVSFHLNKNILSVPLLAALFYPYEKSLLPQLISNEMIGFKKFKSQFFSNEGISITVKTGTFSIQKSYRVHLTQSDSPYGEFTLYLTINNGSQPHEYHLSIAIRDFSFEKSLPVKDQKLILRGAHLNESSKKFIRRESLT